VLVPREAEREVVLRHLLHLLHLLALQVRQDLLRARQEVLLE
jgi:hypothetical protein